MKFLVDVNASGAVVDYLQARGHDVAEVIERNARMHDEDILRWAVYEQRIIVTTEQDFDDQDFDDQDFEEMIWRAGKTHQGVLRLENLPRSARIELLDDFLTQHSDALADGTIVIATSRKVRIRRMIDR